MLNLSCSLLEVKRKLRVYKLFYRHYNLYLRNYYFNYIRGNTCILIKIVININLFFVENFDFSTLTTFDCNPLLLHSKQLADNMLTIIDWK